MSANDEYKDFVMGKFSSMEFVTAKRMFGGYVLHMAGKVLGFIFEGEFLFEPGPEIDRLLPDAPRKELFPGSKLFVVIDEAMGDRDLCSLAYACYDDLPVSKPRRRKGQPSVLEEKKQAEIEKLFPFARHLK